MGFASLVQYYQAFQVQETRTLQDATLLWWSEKHGEVRLVGSNETCVWKDLLVRIGVHDYAMLVVLGFCELVVSGFVLY